MQNRKVEYPSYGKIMEGLYNFRKITYKLYQLPPYILETSGVDIDKLEKSVYDLIKVSKLNRKSVSLCDKCKLKYTEKPHNPRNKVNRLGCQICGSASTSKVIKLDKPMYQWKEELKIKFPEYFI